MSKIMNLIRIEVEKQHLGVREIARRTGCSDASISRWLNGTRVPSVENVEKILAMLGIGFTYEGEKHRFR